MASNNVPRMGYLYDTNAVALLLGQNLNVTMSNPANSGKKIIIEGYSFINQTSTFLMAKFFVNPTGNLPSGSGIAPLPYVLDNPMDNNNVGQFKFAVGSSLQALSGGNQIIMLPLEPSSRNYIESTPLTIMPGMSVGLNISALVAANLTVAIYTREENL